MVTIQTQIPICPDCSEKLVFRRDLRTYICRNCKGRFEIAHEGYTDREITCRRVYPERKI